MAPTKQEVAQEFIARRERNLVYFRRNHPKLYALLKDLKMSRVEVQVGTEGSDVELVADGTPQYQGGAKAYARSEVNQFLHQKGRLHQVRTISPMYLNGINDIGFAGKKVAESLQKSGVNKENFRGQLPVDFLPLVVFMGAGLGYHIQEVLERVDVVDAVIFEPDPEIFAATLLTIDWKSLCGGIKGKRGYSVRFLIGREGLTEEQLATSLGRDLQQSEPMFPVRVSYYNHCQDDRMDRYIDAVTNGVLPNMTAMGNYDDELRRFNNLLHNTARSFPLLVPGFSKASSKPVLIVGSGPSIDDRLEQVKAVRSRVVLVSSGTGIKVLVKNGLSPDFHVELDRRYRVYEHLSVLDPSMIAETTLLASLEVHPLVPGLFKQTAYYVKNTSYAQPFGGKRYIFRGCDPTCTNAAISLFSELGFTNLFLFGCDYGFHSHKEHHSKDSVYGGADSSEVAQSLKAQMDNQFREDKTYEVESVLGGTIYTRPQFDRARRSVEDQVLRLRRTDSSFQVRNCSDGAVIGATPWLSGEAFLSAVEEVEDGNVERFLNIETVDGDVARSRAIASDVIDAMRQRVSSTRRTLNQLYLETRKDMSRVCRLVTHANSQIQQRNGQSGPDAGQLIALHLLSGAVRKFLLCGYSHALAMNDDESLKVFLRDWRSSFDAFLAEVPDHLGNLLIDRPALTEDPLVLEPSLSFDEGDVAADGNN